eukprot:TRINITY_DN1678_c0_g1_i1.p3 TRINITY_DN1678_c0_g1~~TRINITY_DN1678_c0_g1_i1.p3  ORF type:complete len:172 (+),score=58.03 TRINITY_DN1678_c0_g1_i1:40-516(+)
MGQKEEGLRLLKAIEKEDVEAIKEILSKRKRSKAILKLLIKVMNSVLEDDLEEEEFKTFQRQQKDEGVFGDNQTHEESLYNQTEEANDPAEPFNLHTNRTPSPPPQGVHFIQPSSHPDNENESENDTMDPRRRGRQQNKNPREGEAFKNQREKLDCFP